MGARCSSTTWTELAVLSSCQAAIHSSCKPARQESGRRMPHGRANARSPRRITGRHNLQPAPASQSRTRRRLPACLSLPPIPYHKPAPAHPSVHTRPLPTGQMDLQGSAGQTQGVHNPTALCWQAPTRWICTAAKQEQQMALHKRPRRGAAQLLPTPVPRRQTSEPPQANSCHQWRHGCLSGTAPNPLPLDSTPSTTCRHACRACSCPSPRRAP